MLKRKFKQTLKETNYKLSNLIYICGTELDVQKFLYGNSLNKGPFTEEPVALYLENRAPLNSKVREQILDTRVFMSLRSLFSFRSAVVTEINYLGKCVLKAAEHAAVNLKMTCGNDLFEKKHLPLIIQSRIFSAGNILFMAPVNGSYFVNVRNNIYKL